MKLSDSELRLISNCVKGLAIDAVEKANSGHPGMPMGFSDIAAVLWGEVLRHDPSDPGWKNRDRVILSAGHGSMLLYAMLHLSGYALGLDDIKKFRQIGSLTPGHPEYGHTPGVETTTGPLGQGFANAAGFGIASALLASEFNNGADIIKHKIYVIAGDGDLMEGLSYEAAALAGHMGLGNIICIYDSNDITIEGSTALAASEDVKLRFLACGWDVLQIDGHNFSEIREALGRAADCADKPSIIIAKTRIGKGSPNMEGSEACHGAALGREEALLSKKNIGLDPEKEFAVPEQVYQIFAGRKALLKKERQNWDILFKNHITGPLKEKWDLFYKSPDPEALGCFMPRWKTGDSVATRTASGDILKILFEKIPNLIGGSADLGPSNKSFVKGYPESGKNRVGRNIHYGIREHAMAAIQNGIEYYGGFCSFTSTFFVFFDYMRPAVRLAALSHLNSIYVFTHDSFHVGEDGPTHQPVEHLAAARIIPNLTVIRPADAEETVYAWLHALERNGSPTALCLTRQNVPVLRKIPASLEQNFVKGAYLIHSTEGSGVSPDIIIAASGSEVHISIEAAQILSKKGITIHIVSVPCLEIFAKQDESYRNSLFPPEIPVAVVEAGLPLLWDRVAGSGALYICMEGFGKSGPGNKLAEIYGFTPANIAEKIQKFLSIKK